MYWRSKNQLDENLEFKKFSETEFPPEANPQKEVSVNRRDFFKYMGATVVLGGLTSCIRLPKQKIFPYNKSPENIVPGKATYFATTMAIGEELTPLLVESHEGRPTKVEGNPNVDLSQGSTHSLHQASVLSLYDPDRLKKFKINDLQHSSFDKSISFLTESLKKDLKNTAIITGYLPSKVLNQQLKDLQKQGVDVFRADSYNKDNLREGIRLATGKVLDVDYRFDKADVVISFEADFLSNLMTDSVRNTKDFSSRRGADNKSKMNRLYCFEGNHSLVGSTADHRFSVNSDEIKYVLAKISLEISKNSLAGKNFPGSEVIKQLNSMANHKFTSEIEKAISVIVDDLLSKRQKSILLAGYHQDPIVHGLIYILNYALGNSGKTVFYYSVPNLLKVPNKIQKDRFYKNLFKDKYKNVIFVNHDYLHFLPDSKKIEEKLNSLNTVYIGEQTNKTSKLAKNTIPATHYLESWDILESISGQIFPVQPLITPLFESINVISFLQGLLSQVTEDYQLVLTAVDGNHLTKIDKPSLSFKKALHNGYFNSNKKDYLMVSTKDNGLSSRLSKITLFKTGYTLLVLNDYTGIDGRFANNSWLQELPDPVTKITWDNVLSVSPAIANKFNLKLGDKLKITDKSGKDRGIYPVFVLPGMFANQMSISLGYGKENSGAISKGTGFNCHLLADEPSIISDLDIEKVEGNYFLASVQDHNEMSAPSVGFSAKGKERPLYLEASLQDIEKGFNHLSHLEGFNRLVVERDENHKAVAFGSKDIKSLWDEQAQKKLSKDYQWGMSIDLDKCTGCNTCTIACQSENTIPTVGKENVAMGREMHWIRIDRYFKGNEEDAKMVHQPVTCQQCENAPCEQVCPVAATVHSSEGLNDMIYNRCIGTRYCLNNCPYKVRKFNFYDYHQKNPQSENKDRHHVFDLFKGQDANMQMVNNPDVTVRMRGVMEKCTYCVQRINEAKIIAKNNNRKISDGEIQTACQQACPADAIDFGNLLDKKSKINKKKSLVQNYDILGELNTKPRTSYLAGIKNIHPKLAKLTQQKNKKKEYSHHG